VLGVLGVFWSVTWFWWYRDTPAEKPQVTAAEREQIGLRSFESNHSLPWGIALRNGNLWAILIVAFCYVYGLYFFLSWLQTFLVRGRGFTRVIYCFPHFHSPWGPVETLPAGSLVTLWSSDSGLNGVAVRWG